MLFLLIRCVPMDKSSVFLVNNNSPKSINIFAAYILPDTTLPIEKPDLINIEAGKQGYISDRYVDDDDFDRLSTEKLSIFVLSKDTVESYTWEEIRNKYKVLKRYDINKQDLIDMGGSVTYP